VVQFQESKAGEPTNATETEDKETHPNREPHPLRICKKQLHELP
jgi:hypothetical protein